MEIRATDHIDRPLDVVFRTLRDKLPELARFVPDLKQIVVENREEIGEGKIRLHNRWYGKKEIPAIARSLLKPEYLTWLDIATWNEREHKCDWDLEPAFFTQNVKCCGTNYFIADREGRTRVEITGKLQIDLTSVKVVPGFMRARVQSAVENFIIALITPNLKKINRAVEAFTKTAE